MNDERYREIETIVELTAAKLDLKFTQAIGELKLEITNAVHDKISDCQTIHEQRRRWGIGSIIAGLSALIALGAAIMAHI